MGAQQKKADEIQQRLIRFGARTTRVAKMLPRTIEGRYISQQLIRSGLSGAPNYAEARAAESRADFIHKLRIVLKELNETRSWLEQIVANGLFFPRQKGRNYRGKSGTLPDRRGLHQDGSPPRRSNLISRISGFEMQDSSNFKSPVSVSILTLQYVDALT